jgi:hypothetical protein
MPVILPLREAERGRIWVQGKPEQKRHEIPSQQNKLSVVVCACHPSHAGSRNRIEGPDQSEHKSEALFEK